MGIPDHLTCLLRNLYAGQETTVRTEHGPTDWFQIGKGVHQSCILSPCLFNLYAEYIMKKAGLEEAPWSLPKPMSINSVMPSNHLIICHPLLLCPQSFPAPGSFLISQLFASGGKSIGVLASASVLSMNTQDWSPSGWTGWISLPSKGLSRVFSNTTVQKHHFCSAQLTYKCSLNIAKMTAFPKEHPL